MTANSTAATSSSSAHAEAPVITLSSPTGGGATASERPHLGVRQPRLKPGASTPQMGEDSYLIFSDDAVRSAARSPAEKRSSPGQVPENENISKIHVEDTQDTCLLAAGML